MPFCENCGAKLSPGARFCEDCGAEVDLPEKENSSLMGGVAAPDTLNAFEGDWLSNWNDVAKYSSDGELGIILTDIDALSAQLECSADALREAVHGYIVQAESRGVHYYLLDCRNNGIRNIDPTRVESVVELLSQVVSVARPKYLFILGNEKIIDVMKWENQVGGDSDNDVPADLPYVTLDTNSPWNGQRYDFSSVLRTGRLPSYDGECLEDFSAYFDNVAEGIPANAGTIPYGLSARVWEGASNALYQELDRSDVNLSPGINLQNVEQTIPEDVNLLYFNLHGSDQTKFWYGQEGQKYPEAISPEVVAGISHPYFLGVEACYGARYIDGLTPDNSIVLTAMQKGCLALLGSSRIAFGPSEPPGTCADIMIGTFLKKVSEGETAGDAYCAAMKDLMSDSSQNDTTVKTLAEFSLYGDPSVSMGESKAKSHFKSSIIPKGLRVPMPDIRRAMAAVLLENEHRAAQIFRSMIYSQGKSLTSKLSFNMMDYMQGIDPKFYQVGDTGLYQAVFVNNKGPFSRIAKVYFDAKGTIKQQLVSK